MATPHPNLAEIAGLAGYECVMLDGEHGTVGGESLDAMILADYATGATPIFRRPSLDVALVKQALDHGAGGILFPHIRTAEDRKQAVALCRYRPEGRRGVGPGRPIRYGLADPKPFLASDSENTIVALMIEEPQAVENLGPLRLFPASTSSTWDLGTCSQPMDTRSRSVIPWWSRPWRKR